MLDRNCNTVHVYSTMASYSAVQLGFQELGSDGGGGGLPILEGVGNKGGGGGTTILEGVWELSHDWPPFWHFPVILGLFYGQLDIIDPFFLHNKNQFFSITFSSWDKLILIWSKISPKFYIWPFKAFCTNFLLDFPSSWLPFLLFFDLFNPHYSKYLYLIGSIF